MCTESLVFKNCRENGARDGFHEVEGDEMVVFPVEVGIRNEK